jgi:hypothetical protein
MADQTGQLTGVLQVGEAGLTPVSQQAIQITSPVVTKHSTYRTEQAASTPATALGLNGISNITFCKIKFTDKSTGLPKKAVITLNTDGADTATEVLPALTDFFFNTSDTSAGIRAISITTEAGNTTVIDISIAGT